MRLTPAQISYLNARHLVAQLYASGVRSVWLSPGFRNSPIIAAAQMFAGEREDFLVSTAVDERGSGFAALGEALATKNPVAVVCTSGTAVANLYPAVLEAQYAGVSLVVVSCDRPQELLGVGANQAMDQWDFFRSSRAFFASISANNGEITALENLRYLVAKAVFQSKGPRPAPTHINISFREPFAFDEESVNAIPKEFLAVSGPEFFGTVAMPDLAYKNPVLERVAAAESVLLLVSIGACSASQREALAKISRRNGWATYFEGARASEFSNAEFFLKSEVLRAKLQPALVLRFGAPLISKELAGLIKRAPLGQIIFDAIGEARNPEYGAAMFAGGDFDAWIRVLAEATSENGTGDFIATASAADLAVRETLVKYLSGSAFTEWHAARAVARVLKEETDLFLGNSMPVRDFLWVGTNFLATECRVFSNRGLSGIDGLIATAIGIAKGGRDTVAVIGDLSAIHDASSFSLLGALAKETQLTLLIMNNGGGEIFRLVDSYRYPTPQTSFTTPVSVNFSALAAAYGLSFTRVSSEDELSRALAKRCGIRVVEVVVEREASTRIRKEFFAQCWV